MMRTMPSLVKGLARTSFIPFFFSLVSLHQCLRAEVIPMRSVILSLTPVEVGRNILLSNVGRHGYDRYARCHQTDTRRCRDTVKHWHNNIHEKQVVSIGLAVNLVYGLRSVALLVASRQLTKEVYRTYPPEANALTATSTLQPTCDKNFDPILAQVLSSSTSRILGFLAPHNDPPGSLGGGVIWGGASAMALGLLSGRL